MVDPYIKPSFSLRNRIGRFAWNIVYIILFRLSPRSIHVWRVFLLRCFGAKLGEGCNIYPKAVIWAPWNLICEDVVAIADDATIYNPSIVKLGSHCIISQQAYICGASHDYDDSNFSLITAPITLGAYSWICARATVQMGVTIGEGAILGLGGIATRNLDPWSIYIGIPARKIKERKHHVNQ